MTSHVNFLSQILCTLTTLLIECDNVMVSSTIFTCSMLCMCFWSQESGGALLVELVNLLLDVVEKVRSFPVL